MLTLDTTTRSLQVFLGAPKTTNDCPFTTAFTDNGSSFTPGSQNGVTNGTSAVTILSAPAASIQRQLRYFSLYNADTVNTTVIIKYNDNSTLRVILNVLLTVGYTLTYNLDSGWTVTDTNGSIQYVGNTGATGAAGSNGTNGTNGINAYTATTANFTQPASSSTVNVSVSSTAWMVAGQILYVAGGGYYSISSITSGTVVVLTNLGYTGNASPTSTVSSTAGVTPAGLIGATGATGSAGATGATGPQGAMDWLYITNN